MTRDEVIAVMRGFTAALGVRCPYCHVGREGMPLDSFDFASDDKHEKEMARGMLRMVAQLNDELLPEIFDHHERPARVECMTCHRGAARPVMLEDTLAAVAERAGADSMAAEYLRLRERHYGRFAYDFGERSLTLLATRLSAAGKHVEALRALEMNAGYYPESASVAFETGRVYEALEDTPRAIEQYRKALQLQPEHAGAKRRLDALSGG
jgi:tetratricopeptide (TPR) repeat protein